MGVGCVRGVIDRLVSISCTDIGTFGAVLAHDDNDTLIQCTSKYTTLVATF